MLQQNSVPSAATSATDHSNKNSEDTKEKKYKVLFIDYFFNSKTIRTILCRIISLTVQYFRSTSYLWMFNEAFYLHRLIHNAFTTPSLLPLLLIAYGLPTLTTLIYIFCRIFQLDLALITNPLTNHSSSTLNSINSTSTATSGYIQKYLNSNHNDLNTVFNLFKINTQDSLNAKSSKFSFRNQSIKDAYDFQSINVNKNSFNFSNSSNDESKAYSDDDEVLEQLNNLYATSYEDQCWILPSPTAWHEWVINVPNLAILIVSEAFPFLFRFFELLRYKFRFRYRLELFLLLFN